MQRKVENTVIVIVVLIGLILAAWAYAPSLATTHGAANGDSSVITTMFRSVHQFAGQELHGQNQQHP